MSVVVYGASDGLIEIKGDIRDEFPLTSGEAAFLGFDNGVVLRIEYIDSVAWRIMTLQGSFDIVSVAPAVESDEDNYTDRATVKGLIGWVVFGSIFSPRLAFASPAESDTD